MLKDTNPKLYEHIINWNKAHAKAEQYLESIGLHMECAVSGSERFSLFTNDPQPFNEFVGYMDNDCNLDSIEIIFPQYIKSKS